jgi:hypothetical protein
LKLRSQLPLNKSAKGAEMAKAKSMPEAVLKSASRSVSMPDVGERAQAFWSAQGAAADRIQTFFEGWCDRRREAAAEAADCCAQMFSGAGDVSAVPQAWSALMSGSMERFRQDLLEQAALSAQLASDMTGVFSPAADRPRKKRIAVETGKAEGGADAHAHSTSKDVH